ncbi:MAG: hypothetical protein FWG18_03275 [Alphaproteobacteria bacterium]|nr:hypothetical protein [Alphaproteobacteria bacterium]
MSHQFHFYPHILDNLVPPVVGFNVVQDSAEPRLRMYITSRGVKTFFTRKRVHGKDVRIIIGNYPNVEIEDARAALSAKVAAMTAPVKARRRKITLGNFVHLFISKKIHRTHASTAKLTRACERLWAPLYPLWIDKITAAQVSEIFDAIRKNSGAPTANRMRDVMNGVFKFAIDAGYVSENPVADTASFTESRRRRSLTLGNVRRLTNSIRSEKDPIVRSAFLMLIYGFATRSKTFSMQWRDLDFNNDTWGSAPLSDAAVVVLRGLSQNKQFVFPGQTASRNALRVGPGGGRRHLCDPRAAWHRVVKSAKLEDVQMNDIYKFMTKKLAWSPDRETLRRNMNAVINEL